jgi:hypothetical protein
MKRNMGKSPAGGPAADQGVRPTEIDNEPRP